MDWPEILVCEEFLERVTEILNWHDPVNLMSMGAPPDEYNPERGTIVPRLPECHTPQEVHRMLQEELDYWFGAELLDPELDLSLLAADLFSLCVEFLTRPAGTPEAGAPP